MNRFVLLVIFMLLLAASVFSQSPVWIIEDNYSKMGGTAGVDIYFYQKADQARKEILFLKTIEYQMKLIAEIGDEAENDYVLHSLKELDFFRNKFGENIDLWKKGDNSGLLEQVDEYRNIFPKLYQSLLVERNNNWVPQLENYLKTPKTEFVIAGAMHLYGPNGDLPLMKEKGYKVEPLY